jgi:uncharacterized Tic20 family protein
MEIRLINMTTISNPINSQEHWLSALAHAGFLFGSFGFLLPLLLWFAYRRKSSTLTFQLLQSFSWLVIYPLYLVVVALVMLVTFLIGFLTQVEPVTLTSLSPAFITFAVIHSLIQLFLALIYFVPALVGVVSCAMGKPFHYPWIGAWLERYLNDAVDETREDHWVAACNHLCVMLPFWGLLAPLLTWFTQKKRSAWLKFQSAQTVLFQVGWSILFLATVIVSSLLPIGLFAILLLATSKSELQAVGLVFAGLGLILMIIGAVLVVIAPLYNTLGLVAAWRVLRRGDYRYLFFARLGEWWIKLRSPVRNVENSV